MQPRSFTMTLAHRAVGDIRRGGFRQLRNYVDMCSSLAKRPQQKDFFAYAQKALQRTDSCYYSLVHNLLDTADEDRLCTVGVNMGFGGLIYGASEMKKQADVDGKPFSWITAAHCGAPALSALVAAAEKKGSFVWVLDATEGDPSEAASLAKAFPKCAFGVLAAPEALTPDRVAQLAECLNVVVLPLLQSPELTPDVCHAARALKAKQMLYMLTVLVDDTCAEEALQDDWMESVAQEARLCMYARRPGISPEKSEVLHRGIVAGRLETGCRCCCWIGTLTLPTSTTAFPDNARGQCLQEEGRPSRCSCTQRVTLQPQDMYNKSRFLIASMRQTRNRLFVMLVRAAAKSSKSLGQFAWFMRFAQLTAQDQLQLIDREQRHCLGWAGRVGLHAAQHPRLQNAHQGTGKKTAHQQVFIGTNAGAQLFSALHKDGGKVIKYVLLQAVLPGIGQCVAVKHFIFQQVIFHSFQQGIPAGIGRAFHQKLGHAALEVPVHQIVLILKMIVKGIAPDPGVVHNIVDRDLFQRGGRHQIHQALGQQALCLI